MVAALTPVLVSLPVTVTTHGVPLAMHCLVNRSLSAAGSAEGSILYFRVAGAPMPNSQALALWQMMRPGPTLVGAGGATGWDCAQTGVAPQVVNATVMPNHRARVDRVIQSFLLMG